jgi:hypothetical protein
MGKCCKLTKWTREIERFLPSSSWKDPNKNPSSARFMTQELHLENAVRAGKSTLIFYRGSMERLSSTNLEYEQLEKHLRQEEVSNGVFQWIDTLCLCKEESFGGLRSSLL